MNVNEWTFMFKKKYCKFNKKYYTSKKDIQVFMFI